MKRSAVLTIGANAYKMRHEIKTACKAFQFLAQKWLCFIFSAKNRIRLSHVIYDDICFIQRVSVLQVLHKITVSKPPVCTKEIIRSFMVGFNCPLNRFVLPTMEYHHRQCCPGFYKLLALKIAYTTYNVNNSMPVKSRQSLSVVKRYQWCLYHAYSNNK